MLLTKVYLSHFRNFENRTFDIHPKTTMVIGENARGKTNLLESVFVVMNGIGFRESREEELIQWNETRAVVENVWQNESSHLFQILMTRRETGVEKKYFIDKTVSSLYQYRQHLGKAVLFAPEQIDIVSGSPDIRRDYINKFIGTYDPEYKKRVHNYDAALRKRNKILEISRDESALVDELAFWNQYLHEQSIYITAKREEYIDYLNKHTSIDNRHFSVEYIRSPFTLERAAQYFPKEKIVRKTLIGPQKEDIKIYLEKNNIKTNIQMYGSRSEQRLGVFWLKLNELSLLEELFHKKPILLLDDVFSELDKYNKKLTLNLVTNYQTILTTTEAELPDIIHTEHAVITMK